MSKRKANITPADIGGYYQDPERRIRQLVECETEPHATMKMITDDMRETAPISEFKDFVRLKPVVPRMKKATEVKTRKTRSDAGTHRKSQQAVDPGIADKKGDNLTIHTPTGLGDDTEYKVSIAGFEATGFLLRETILAALEGFNGKIPDCLDESERKILESILGAEVSDPGD